MLYSTVKGQFLFVAAEIHIVTVTLCRPGLVGLFGIHRCLFQWRAKMAVITMLLTAPQLKLEQAKQLDSSERKRKTPKGSQEICTGT